MDVWFDSGTSWYSALKPRLKETDLQSSGTVVDLIVEGEDQYRGWFQSLMLTSMAVNHQPPYSNFIFIYLLFNNRKNCYSWVCIR